MAGWLVGWPARQMDRLMNEYPMLLTVPFYWISYSLGFFCVCFVTEAIIFGMHSYFNLTDFLTALITQNARNCQSNILYGLLST